MVKLCAKKITSFLIYNEAIDSKESENYEYGFETLIAFLLNIFVILTISCMLNKFKYTLLFLCCYCPIRQYTGGYHADNYKKCLGVFITIYLINLVLLTIINFFDLKEMLIILTFISYVGIWILSPIEHREKPLSDEEINHYKKVSRTLISIVLIFIFVGINSEVIYEYSAYAASSIIWIFIMINLAIIKNRGGIHI
ncbi:MULTISPECIES: accessory gene regulator B family protein [unclassified Clostridioides]|uniref:accessory gene regulator ArgB-like protein n=1 Tax=unclassified Clostridioides TaxID=2635829 RepID=UPI001D0FBDBF|nr:accessory gene regulator B family protein [Clostridioides sp. ZZV14-6150]MCC0723358.1 accessory gene regulator B family protein [Clostridioides sp. ZZV14-6104]MCC0742775.1 accessory gene regulator B family protein [Clostridioides sp. ZZV14-6044]